MGYSFGHLFNFKEEKGEEQDNGLTILIGDRDESLFSIDGAD